MGDQVGVAVSGTLYFVSAEEFGRLRSLKLSELQRTAIFATFCRINALYMIARAGSGHIGSSFSSMDVMSWLQYQEIRDYRDGSQPQDVFFSSKGHDAPALYSTLIGLGKLDFDLIHSLRRLDGLPGHPDVATPGIVTNTGSLGMGVSKGKGIALAKRLTNRSGNVFVLTGDGELQEGQFWESLISAANHGLHELFVVIDHNKLQSDTLVEKVSSLGDLEAKLGAFGWHVERCDGNDLEDFSGKLAACKRITDRPKAIIADTVKGRGVSFMEHTSIDSDVELYRFHSGAPTSDAYVRAAQELIDTANRQLKAAGAAALELETVTRSVAPATADVERLVPAYSKALIEQARANPRLVALDGDLILDTGLIPFSEEFPDRFIECGIAEQDMVSQAGGMALMGLLPVVHSFSCFLSARPNEQIYNNATERTKIIYVGSLAGILPGGPGHSHQAVRDISALAGIPGLVIVEPSCESEVGLLLDWAINANECSTYLRLTSVPYSIPFSLSEGYRPEVGKGVTLEEGDDAVVIAYGPIMLSHAVNVARRLRQQKAVSVKVINLPWLNLVDADWLSAETEGREKVVSLDNHYRVGGQADRIAAALLERATSGQQFVRLGLSDLPVCGTSDEVLGWHALDEPAIMKAILD